MGKADFLMDLALQAWPLLKEEVAELVKTVLRELAREEAKKGLKAVVKAGAQGLKGLLEAEAPPSTSARPSEVADRELLLEPPPICIDNAPALLPPLQHRVLPIFDDVILARVMALAPSLLGRLGPQMEPVIEALLRGKVIAPGVQSALHSSLELPPAVKEALAGKLTTGGVQNIHWSTLRAFASRAAGPSSTTATTAGAGAEALRIALANVLDFLVYASAAGVIALVAYLIWRGPGGDDE